MHVCLSFNLNDIIYLYLCYSQYVLYILISQAEKPITIYSGNHHFNCVIILCDTIIRAINNLLHYVSPLIACIFTYIMTSLTHVNVQPVDSNTTIPEIYICALEIIVFSILLILTQDNPFSALVIMGLHIYNHSMYEFENYKKPGIIITLLFTLVFASLYAPDYFYTN